MSYSPDQFKALVSKERGLASANLFKVTLPALEGATKVNGESISGYAPADFNILCRGVNLPGRQITSYDRVIGMNNIKVGYGYAVSDVTMNFYVTNGFKLKSYFEDWQQMVVTNEPPYEVGYYKDYVKDIKIDQLRKGEAIPVVNVDFGFNINESLGGAGQLISDALPTVSVPGTGGIDLGNLAQGNLSIAVVSPENVIYTCTLEDAYPITINDITLDNALDGLTELQVTFAYKNWKGETPEQKKTIADRVQDAISGAVDAAGAAIGGFLGGG